MSLSLHERSLRVYCPTHRTVFRAERLNTIHCKDGEEILAEDFPFREFWEYCCDCQTFCPSDIEQGVKARERCASCDRHVARRYLCPACKVLSLESDDPGAGRKLFHARPGKAVAPSCPGCLRPDYSLPAPHRCVRLEAEFLTSRGSCPFCEEDVADDGRPTQAVARELQHEAAGRREDGPSHGAVARHQDNGAARGASHAHTVRVADWVAQTGGAVAEGSAAKRLRGPAVAVLLVLGAVVGWGWWSWRQTVAVTPVPEPSAARTQAGLSSPPRMAYVAGGQFTMGRADGDEYERPSHMTTVEPFFIDLYEVTCEEYARFVEATGRAAPRGWGGGQYPPGGAQQPVTGVNWVDADAYARWVGKRLPIEAEWEFAARGTDGRRYPWGNEWKVGLANASGGTGGGMADVGTFKGVAPSGAFDMVGNAWEWTADDLRPYPGGTLPESNTDGLKVIRGGFWGSGITKATTTFRRGWPARGATEYSNTGFRCALTPSAQPGVR